MGPFRFDRVLVGVHGSQPAALIVKGSRPDEDFGTPRALVYCRFAETKLLSLTYSLSLDGFVPRPPNNYFFSSFTRNSAVLLRFLGFVATRSERLLRPASTRIIPLSYLKDRYIHVGLTAPREFAFITIYLRNSPLTFNI
jgi:hypothetical protein